MNPYLAEGVTTPRLFLRKIEPGDFDRALPFFEHPQSHQYWDTGGTDPVALCHEWYNKQQFRYASGRGGALALLEKSSDLFVGWCGLLVQNVDGRREVEVGYSILPAHWRKGYASEAARACMAFAFDRKLAETLISIIQVDNLPSQGVAEKNGMTRGRQTLYHANAVYIYEITSANWDRAKARQRTK